MADDAFLGAAKIAISTAIFETMSARSWAAAKGCHLHHRHEFFHSGCMRSIMILM